LGPFGKVMAYSKKSTRTLQVKGAEHYKDRTNWLAIDRETHKSAI